MKVGIRKPSVRKSVRARTTGRVKRQVKSTVNPAYGKKGVGFVKNPERSVKNKIYHKTTVGVGDIARGAMTSSDKSVNNISAGSNTLKNSNAISNRNKKPNKLFVVVMILLCIFGLVLSPVLWGLFILIGAAGILAYIYLIRKEKSVATESDYMSKESSVFTTVKCPFCCAIIDVPLDSGTVVCEYCDSKLRIPDSLLNKKTVSETRRSEIPLLKKINNKRLLTLAITVLVIGLLGAIASTSNSNKQNISEKTSVVEQEEEQKESVENLSPETEETEAEELASEQESIPEEDEAEVTPEAEIEENVTFEPNMVPAYADYPYEYVNEGVPFFESDFSIDGLVFSDLDELGRAGVAMAKLGKETMPTEERGDISSVHPSGWNDIQYEGIDGLNVFNRCHLIGWQLSGENANEKNLITGTRHFNTQGMEPFEKKTANYIKETGNHVYYRVTPVFTENNLIADGVLMEAESVEDDGLSFCVFCYNVQPDVEIDYKTGEVNSDVLQEPTPEPIQSAEIENTQEAVSDAEESTRFVAVPAGENEVNESSDQEETQVKEETETEESEPSNEVTYIGNSNTGKFHKPYCGSVKKMADHNKVFFYGDRQEVIDAGYVPCKNCNP